MHLQAGMIKDRQLHCLFTHKTLYTLDCSSLPPGAWPLSTCHLLIGLKLLYLIHLEFTEYNVFYVSKNNYSAALIHELFSQKLRRTLLRNCSVCFVL